MPYYREQFLNRSTPQAWTGKGPLTVVQDSTEMLSFRTRKHQDALTSIEVSDQSVDPYAYFLDETSRRKYQARLAERGLRSKGDPDRGHAFELKRHRLLGALHNTTNASNGDQIEGALVYPVPSSSNSLDSVHNGTLTSPASYTETGLDQFAQRAYNRVAPTSVVWDAAQFLGELREGLPNLAVDTIKHGARFYKGLGSDYLNLEFGWKPFISDLQNAAKALANATHQLANQGERVHRKYSVPAVSSSASASFNRTTAVTCGIPGLLSPAALAAAKIPSLSVGSFGANSDGNYMKTKTVTRWFEGEFSSFYPLNFDPDSYLSRLSALVNLKLTPAVLWELSPWSWMVDWYLQIGDTIAANEKAANDLLVMHYGYAMERTVYTTELSWRRTGANTTTGVRIPSSGRYFAVTEYKRRIRANPYGFRLGGTSALSGSQLAILGALGLTKAR
jgi:hypothetical protein